MLVQTLILLAGLALYAGYGISGLCWLLSAALITWLIALLLPRYRWLMWPMVVGNGVLLTLLKLQPVTGWSVAAPLGVSYFTLQIISYIVDVQKGKYPPERNFLTFCLYLTYFPHLWFGPIQRYDTMQQALQQQRVTWDGISQGTVRILWGLMKKLCIAARAGVITAAIAAAPETYRGGYALLAMLLYSIQLYADFSGGMDIVLGVSQILGLRLSENFRAPYLSQSFAEFWRRWHMTLGAWLKDYVYIPLGGNRKGGLRKTLNLIVTFLVSGLWHGVHYVLWGLFNGIFVACGDRFRTRSRILNCACTFLLISVLWSFFIWSDTRTACSAILSLFTTWNYGQVFADLLNLGLNLGEWLVLAIASLWLFGCDIAGERVKRSFLSMPPAFRVAWICGLALLVLTFGMYGIGFEAEQFIYSRF